MKSRDLPITYSRNAKIFFYKKPVNVEVYFKIKPLSSEKLEKKRRLLAIFLPCSFSARSAAILAFVSRDLNRIATN